MDSESLKKYKDEKNNLLEDEQKYRDMYLRKLSTGEILGPTINYSSMDKQWLKRYDEEHLKKEIPDESMFQYFAKSCQNHLDNVAIDLRMGFNKFAKPIRKLTYGQTLDEVITIACGFKSFGIDEKGILLEMLPNLIESRESIYAANANGTTVYPISPMIPTNKMDEIINGNKIKNVVMYGGFYNKFKEVLDNENVEKIIYLNGLESFNPIIRKIIELKDKENKFKIPEDDRIITWNKILEAGKKYREDNNIKSYNDFKSYYEKDHIAVIVGTSGTTGVPKGACLTDYAINACDFSEQVPHPFEVGEKNLDVLIQSISFGLGIMHHTMSGGLYNIIIPEMVTDKIAKLIKKFKPQNFSGGPIHYENILRSEEYKNGELVMPKNYISGGASLSKSTESILNNNVDENYVEPKEGETKVFVRQGLGSTENMGTGVFTTRGAYKFGSVGIPIAYSNCAIFKYGTDEELQYLGDGIKFEDLSDEEKQNYVGEICMTGPTMMQEYLNNPEETEKVIKVHSDGTKWLHLGDEGYMDKDGNVFMIDRYKNIFMRNGFNVHPSKIQESLKELPFVKDVAVVGVNHPVEMSVPVAFVVLEDGMDEEIAKQDMNQKCNDTLEEYYVPYEYIFVKELPRNLGGKVDNAKLVKDNKVNYDDSKESKMNLR